MNTEGLRLADVNDGDLPHGIDTSRPCYWLSKPSGLWYLYLPAGGIGCLANHTVTVHEDGSISVSPSILLHAGQRNGRTPLHGYLRRGVWQPC